MANQNLKDGYGNPLQTGWYVSHPFRDKHEDPTCHADCIVYITISDKIIEEGLSGPRELPSTDYIKNLYPINPNFFLDRMVSEASRKLAFVGFVLDKQSKLEQSVQTPTSQVLACGLTRADIDNLSEN